MSFPTNGIQRIHHRHRLSGFDPFEECDEYNEDACYIADSRAAAEAFMENRASTGMAMATKLYSARLDTDTGSTDRACRQTVATLA